MAKKYFFNFFNLHNESAGTGTFAKNLILGIKSQRRDLIESCILLFNSNATKWIELAKSNGYKTIVFNVSKNRLAINIFSYLIPSIYLKSNYTYFSFIAVIPVFRNPKVKYITTIHDTIALKKSAKYKGIRKRLISRSFKYAINGSDSIITVSPNSKNDLQNFFNKDKLNIKIIPNFIKEINNNYFESNYNVHKRNYFLFVGNIQPGKNILSLIRSFRLFVDENDSFDLVIVGNNKTSHYKEVKELVNSLGLKKYVYFKGFVKDTRPYYKNAHSFVFPSFYEGFGIPILEALKNNCTIVCSNTSSIPYVAGETAFYFDPYSIQSLHKALKSTLVDYKVKIKKNKYKLQLKKFQEKTIINDFIKVLG